MSPSQVDPNSVFLNIPYDEEFFSLYIAYVVGLFQLGLVPHLASEIPGGKRRLDKILVLIESCRYSIHDLSRVELSLPPSATPRFNMPLELGMTIAWEGMNPDRHSWSVWESAPYRLQRSTSDLNGTDPYIHRGTVEGVLSELRSLFVFIDSPSVEQMMKTYKKIESKLGKILATAGTRNLYSAAVFKALCFVALNAAKSGK